MGNEVKESYLVSVRKYQKADLVMEFFKGLERKGYLINDVEKLKDGGIFVCEKYYDFGEIDRVPIKRNSLESRV